MWLKGWYGPHVINSFFNCFVERKRFMRTSYEDYYLNSHQFNHLFNKSIGRKSKHTSRASITVPTPTVSAWRETSNKSLPKKRAFAIITSSVNVLTLVLDVKLEPGLLCPSDLIPFVNSSIPHESLISCTIVWHSASKSVALPSSIWVFSGSISMCLKKLFNINEW